MKSLIVLAIIVALRVVAAVEISSGRELDNAFRNIDGPDMKN